MLPADTPVFYKIPKDFIECQAFSDKAKIFINLSNYILEKKNMNVAT